MIRHLLLSLCCIVLVACSGSNPLLGRWEGEVTIPNDFVRQSIKAMGIETRLSLEFTPKEMISRRGDAETRTSVRYRIEKNAVYMTADTGKQEQSETWTLMPIKGNTLEYTVLPGITATLTRVK